METNIFAIVSYAVSGAEASGSDCSYTDVFSPDTVAGWYGAPSGGDLATASGTDLSPSFMVGSLWTVILCCMAVIGVGVGVFFIVRSVLRRPGRGTPAAYPTAYNAPPTYVPPVCVPPTQADAFPAWQPASGEAAPFSVTQEITTPGEAAPYGYCPGCGVAVSEADADFCRRCGRRLDRS